MVEGKTLILRSKSRHLRVGVVKFSKLYTSTSLSGSNSPALVLPSRREIPCRPHPTRALDHFPFLTYCKLYPCTADSREGPVRCAGSQPFLDSRPYPNNTLIPCYLPSPNTLLSHHWKRLQRAWGATHACSHAFK